MLEQILQDNPDDVRLVFRHFPLNSHDKSLLAAQAVEAAGEQDKEKFWELHELLFEKQAEWGQLSMDDFRAWLKTQAEALDLDVDTFTADLDSPELVARVKQAQTAATQSQVGYTPYLVIDNRVYPESVPMDYDKITAMIRLIQIADRQFTTCPEMTIDPQKQYLATFKTSQGDFTAQLYADKAPVTVNAFVFLAREGWYNNISFHRVIPDFIVQSGDPTGTGYGGPGFAYINEISDLTFDRPGMLAMANSGADTNGSQFFITYVPLEQLNGDYTIFGQVIEGMDVVEKLTPRDPENSANPPPGDTLIEVIITEN